MAKKNSNSTASENQEALKNIESQPNQQNVSDASTLDENIEAKIPEVKAIKLEDLIPFDKHPFKLYEGQRFTDMVDSVRVNGILLPIIVRPHIKEGKFEILSGHNRVAAAKEAGIKETPVIIRKNLTDDEALLIVTETNLIQRSFADLKHSEKAISLATHYEAMKMKPGYRSDL